VPKGLSNSAGSGPLAKLRLLLDALLLIAVITLAITGGPQPQSLPDADLNRADPFADADPKPAHYALAKAKDQGDFKLVYEPKAAFHTANANCLVGIDQQGIECIIDSLNERIALPFDIVITFTECDGPNAFYDDRTHRITLCYDLIDDYYDLFSDKIRDAAKLDEAVSGTVAHTLLHEMGHALIDAWKLPITGKEEDAADQLSTLILIEETENGEQVALDSALSFRLYADFDIDEERPYWDEHSLDEQRFYGILCMLYGHDPEKYGYLIMDGTLPPSRAELCQDDYARVKTSWQTLLAPFVKTPPDVTAKIRLR
jgi:Putative metallopeptidase